MSAPIFGEWLRAPVKGRALRLVIEEMSARASKPSVAEARLKTVPDARCTLTVSSGEAVMPWRGEIADSLPCLTWSSPEEDNSGDAGNFDALIAAILSPEIAVESQRLFPDLIHRFGFMPGNMNPGHKDDRAFALDYSGTTWGPACYWDVFAWSQDMEFLQWFSDACAQWTRWWLNSRDKNGDGWIEPGTNGCKPSTSEFRMDGAKANPELG